MIPFDLNIRELYEADHATAEDTTRCIYGFGEERPSSIWGDEGDRKAMVDSQPLCKLKQWDEMARPMPREYCYMRLLALDFKKVLASSQYKTLPFFFIMKWFNLFPTT
jgi:hypothetical protein